MRLTLLGLCGLLLFSCTPSQATVARGGELDLSSMDLKTSVKLKGPWEEYWGQLVPPESNLASNTPERGTAVNLPGVWNKAHRHPVYGVATYRLTIKLPTGPSVWGLQIPSILTSFRLYVDGKLIAQAGQVGFSPETSSPAYTRQLVFFHADPTLASGTELLLQVANFSYRKSGVTGSFLLGTAPVMVQRQEENALAEYLLLGALFILVVYYLALSLIRPSDKASLWFGLFCLAVLVRLIATGDHTMETLLPGFSWEVRKKLELLIFSLGAVTLVQFLRHLFPQEMGKWVPRTLNIVNLVLGLLIVVFPIKWINQAVPVMELLVTLGFLLVLLPLGLAARRRKPGARLVFLSLLVLAFSAVHDILYANLVISSFFILPYAFLAFVLAQTLLLVRNFTISYRLAEARGQELKATNDSLNRFVPADFLVSLGKSSINEVKLGQQTLAHMSILFADIRRFTSLAESLSPDKTFRLLNAYFGRIGPVIRQNGGFIDKYMGDGFMALFPRSSEDGLQAAIGIQRALQEYNAHRLKSGYTPLKVGTGVHAGPLMIGTIGEEGRMDTTVISDAVNLASRLESLTKTLGSGTMVTLSFLDSLEHPEHFHWRYAGVVRMYGKKAALEVAHIWDGLPDEEGQLYQETKATFEEGISLYRTGQMAEAEQAFLSVLGRHPSDVGAQYYASRARLLKEFGLPEDWDAIEDQLQK